VIRYTAFLIGCVIAASASVADAQSTEYRVVESPFQEDFEFRVNSDLRPMVEVAGVRWTRFGVHVKGEREIEADKNIPVKVELGFVNTNPNGVKILVIALFEDASGKPLERIECSRVSANNDRLKESSQKFKVSGAVLNATRRVYLFCEVE
jgi:hypothetical protein